MKEEIIQNINQGLEAAYINGNLASNLEYKPSFISNNPEEGKKVISSIEEELLRCEQFQISVAFITMGGITPLLQTLKELERKGIPGQILTTNYLDFSEPRALAKLNEMKNITLKMYDVEAADNGFHTKGYIFKKEEVYRIILGSSNMTSAALTSNIEWNTKIISTEQGEVASEIVKEFNSFWKSEYALDFETFYEIYKARYEIIKHQREEAKKDRIPSFEKYKLKPNSMQEEFIVNLRKIIEKGEKRALLISATGTGKTYASAFAMRELGFKRVLFLVHRAQLAKQAKKSFERVFNNSVSMGIVGDGKHEYDCDFVFAMVETLNRDQHLFQYEKDAFDCIILDEAHHSPANTYQKVMNYFEPQLFLGMTATPDKRDDHIEGRNVYELFHHQIAHEIRLQKAMEEHLLCPFHYFGISDIALIDDKTSKGKNLTEKDFNLLTSEERVDHIIEQAQYYGYSGERVKGLIFCSRNKECETLSNMFNERGYRTLALSNETPQKLRETAFERLAMKEEDATEELQPLDYIFSVDILNEGIDIVEVNQVIMLRPTQSPIVFIQQLGRGLRKAEGKEYVVIVKEYKTYYSFAEQMEKKEQLFRLSEQEKTTLEYLSKTILSGVRPDELEILRLFLEKNQITYSEVIDSCKERYGYEITTQKIDLACDVLKGKFVTNSTEREKFYQIDILEADGENRLKRILSYTERLAHKDFYDQVQDIVAVGLARYQDKYAKPYRNGVPFVLYEKYSRRDVSLLMNAGKDLSSTMYGMSQLGDDVFIFVTYHKEENTDEEKEYVDGKPDYADEFVDNVIFRWDSQIDKKLDGAYMDKVLNTPRKHLFVQKTDAENNFFYMGEFDVLEAHEAEKKNNRGVLKPICKLKFKMQTAVREDLLRYLQSGKTMEEK